MRVVYHPAVQKDVNGILHHYDAISSKLADEFWQELMACLAATAHNPGRSHPDQRGLRRVNLPRFPYHFLFREFEGKIRVIVVRHNKRDTEHGTRRA
jgi:toxin ParE1/3/4